MTIANKDGRVEPGEIQIKYAPKANTHTVAAGSTTTVFTNTTFDGSSGSSAYTIGDIVAALKQLGVLQA